MPLPTYHKFTGLSFALINQRFLQEIEKTKLPYRYVTANVRKDLIETVFSFTKNGHKVKPIFTPAYKILNISEPKKIKLDRIAHSLEVYRFPTYFLNLDQLLDCFQKLIMEEKLTNTTLKYYLQTKMNYQEISEMKSKKELRLLGELLTVQGPIYKSSLTGEELRKIIDNEVEDEPELKIIEIENWRKGIENIIKIAKTD